MLVILRGDFDTASGFKLPGWLLASQDMRFNYLGYIFDVAMGYAERLMAFPHGGAFSKVLGDPSLYDPPIVTPDPNMPPAQPKPAAPRLPTNWSSDNPAPTVVPMPPSR